MTTVYKDTMESTFLLAAQAMLSNFAYKVWKISILFYSLKQQPVREKKLQHKL